MEPKRKQGVCLASRTCSLDELANRFANCERPDHLPKCSQQMLNETEFSLQDVAKLRNDDCKGSEALFRNPLDDLLQGSRKRILPVQINQNGLPVELNQAEQIETSPPVEPFPYAGYVGQIVEILLISMVLLCLKLLPVEESISEKAKACMIRGSFMMLFCAISIVYQGQSFKIAPGEYLIIFFRSLLGGTNILLIFLALNYISMGESTAIIYSSMVWTCILSFIVLKEPLQIGLLLALPLSALGIIFVAQPDLIVDPCQEVAQWLGFPDNNLTRLDSISVGTQENIARKLALDLDCDITTLEEAYFASRWPGIAISILNSVMFSVVIIILKFRKKTSIATCSFYLGLAMVVVSLGTQLVVGFGAWPTSLLECLLHVCVGIFSFGSQNLFQWVLIYVPAGTYSMIGSLEIVFGFILGALFLNDLVLWTSVVGSVLIIIVVVMLVLNDHLVRGFESLCSH